MSLDPTKDQNRISDCHVEAGTINLNPTPSITVGTQVRLTGVVSEIDSDGDIWIKIPDSVSANSLVILPPANAANLEVIRQPFKRGEVVYHLCLLASPPFVVVNDEVDGTVDVTNCQSGDFAKANLAKDFERRP